METAYERALRLKDLERQLQELRCGVPDSLDGVLPEDLEIILDAARKIRAKEKAAPKRDD